MVIASTALGIREAHERADESEQLDVEPARYFVRVTKREKRACYGCGQGSLSAAPLPPRIIEKGVASDGW